MPEIMRSGFFQPTAAQRVSRNARRTSPASPFTLSFSFASGSETVYDYASPESLVNDAQNNLHETFESKGAQGIPIGFHCYNSCDTTSKVGVISGTGTRGDDTSAGIWHPARQSLQALLHSPSPYHHTPAHQIYGWIAVISILALHSRPSALTESLRIISAKKPP
ncbi:hypothetical protein BJV78DRAFT_85945 [Lactifluus subvellereus]|nr:hypothetical protein BJV78DRAFT_85945 [Lactifluus subvellereus]